MTLASRLRCKSTARISNYQEFLQKNRRKILDGTILLHKLCNFHSHSLFFALPLWNEVLLFSIPFDGVWGCLMLSSHLATSIILHYRQLLSTYFPLPSELSHKTREISQKTWEFFSAPSERIFLTANRNTNKAGNKGPRSLEVQPLIARTDNFQAWTNNYNIRREKKVIKMRGWKGDDRSQKK